MKTELDTRVCLIVVDDDEDRNWICGLVQHLAGWYATDAPSFGFEEAVRLHMHVDAVILGDSAPPYSIRALTERCHDLWPHAIVVKLPELPRPYTLASLQEALGG